MPNNNPKAKNPTTPAQVEQIEALVKTQEDYLANAPRQGDPAVLDSHELRALAKYCIQVQLKHLRKFGDALINDPRVWKSVYVEIDLHAQDSDYFIAGRPSEDSVVLSWTYSRSNAGDPVHDEAPEALFRLAQQAWQKHKLLAFKVAFRSPTDYRLLMARCA